MRHPDYTSIFESTLSSPEWRELKDYAEKLKEKRQEAGDRCPTHELQERVREEIKGDRRASDEDAQRLRAEGESLP